MFDTRMAHETAEACDPATSIAATRLHTASERTSLCLADLFADTGAPVAAGASLTDLRFPLRRVRCGESLFRAGDRFESIYIVRAGFFKTTRVQSSGVEQIMAFPGRGDALGLDGVGSGRYRTDVCALDTGLVAVVAFDQLQALAGTHPAIDRLLHLLFAREMTEQQQMICLLGTLMADARVAAFLLHLSGKFARFGQSPTAFLLRMTRQEIGSYLGIKLETVSRSLSMLAAAGLIRVSHRSIMLVDLGGLRDLVAPRSTGAAPRRLAQKALRPRRSPVPRRFAQASAYA